MRVSVADGAVPSGILLITNELQASPSGGRELLCKLNRDALRSIFGDRLAVLELKKRPLRGIPSIAGAFRGYLDGFDPAAWQAIVGQIDSGKIGRVFVDGSNLGQIVKMIARRFPRIQTVTFFHNVEARFFWGAFKRARTLHALAVVLVNYLAERKSVRYSRKIVCLSDRDSQLLSSLYGRGATHLSPMALQDQVPPVPVEGRKPPPERFALFVGGIFYANRDGIAWFVENVAPHISIKTVIVGKGFEAMRAQLGRAGKVEVVGAVDSLGDWYRDALFVIAPILDGSGMKTKVAEALMYGKRVVGTPEAFSGYEDVAPRVGWVCATASDFVDAIAAAQQEATQSFLPELRALYEEKYSFDAARSRLAEIMEPAGSTCQ